MSDQIKFSEHPDYKEHKGVWEQQRDLYEGKASVVATDKYLPLVGLEKEVGGTELYSVRASISTYTNFIDAIVESYLSIFFKEEPDTSKLEGTFGEYLNDVDGEQTSLIDFTKEVVRNILVYGKPIIWTNSYDLPTGDARNRPFWKLVLPLDAPDWEMEGPTLSKFRVSYMKIEPRKSLINSEAVSNLYTEVYMLTDTGTVQCEVYRLKKGGAGNTSDEYEKVGNTRLLTGYKEIPISQLLCKKSWIDSILPEQKKHFNLSSWFDTGLYYQAHPVRYLSNADQAQKLSVNAATWLFLKEGQEVGQLEPSSRGDLKERLKQCEMNLTRIAFNLARQLPADSGLTESDKSQQERKDELVSKIKSTINLVQSLMNRAIRHWIQVSGKSVESAPELLLKDNITTEDIDQQIRIFSSVKDIISRYPRWAKETYKSIALAQDLDKTDEIISEIESTDIEDPAEQMGLDAGGITDKLRGIVKGKSEQEADPKTDKAPSGDARS